MDIGDRTSGVSELSVGIRCGAARAGGWRGAGRMIGSGKLDYFFSSTGGFDTTSSTMPKALAWWAVK